MKLLVISDAVAEANRLAAGIRGTSCDVIVSGGAAATARIAEGAIDAVVVDGSPFGPALDLIRAIRNRLTPRYVLTWLVTRGLSSDQVRQAYEAGADGEVPTLDGLDLLPRLGLFNRLHRPGLRRPSEAIRAVPLKSTSSVPKVGDVKPSVASIDLLALRSDLTQAFGTFATLPATSESAPASFVPSFASGIVLSNVEHELALRVSLAVDTENARALTHHMFGESSPELSSELLGELANIAMGTCKAALARTAISFTGGLPEKLDARTTLDFTAACQRLETMVFVLGTVRVHARIGLSCAHNITTSVDKLMEGMVLAKDLYNARGILVVTAKTRLSSTMADRLRAALPPTMMVEIAAGVS